jgi:hypothetical protein
MSFDEDFDNDRALSEKHFDESKNQQNFTDMANFSKKIYWDAI